MIVARFEPFYLFVLTCQRSEGCVLKVSRHAQKFPST